MIRYDGILLLLQLVGISSGNVLTSCDLFLAHAAPVNCHVPGALRENKICATILLWERIVKFPLATAAILTSVTQIQIGNILSQNGKRNKNHQVAIELYKNNKMPNTINTISHQLAQMSQQEIREMYDYSFHM